MTPKPVDTGGVEGGGEAEAPALTLADETRRQLEALAKAVEQIDTDAISPEDVAGWIREVATEKPSDSTGSQEGLAAGLHEAAEDYLSRTTYLVAKMDGGAGEAHKKLNQKIRDSRVRLSNALAATPPTPMEDGSGLAALDELEKHFSGRANDEMLRMSEVWNAIHATRTALTESGGGQGTTGGDA